MGFPVTLTSFSKLVEESLVTNYVREEYVTKSKNYSEKKKRSSLLAEPTFLVTLGTCAKSSTSTFSSSRQKLGFLLAGEHTCLVSTFSRVISLEILACLRIRTAGETSQVA